MRLDFDTLSVQSFSTEADREASGPDDTGPGGPYSQCYLCRPTDPGAPTCEGDSPA